MALRHTRLTDLSDLKQLDQLNQELSDITNLLNQGGEIRVEEPRASERSRFEGVTSEGAPHGASPRLRAIPTDPSSGGRLKLQFWNGKKWEDV